MNAALLLDDNSVAYIVPGDPRPEQSPAGVPMLSLLGTKRAASLQVGVQWWPAADELAAFEATLQDSLGVISDGLPVMSADAVSVERVVLESLDQGLGNGGQDVTNATGTELATSASSGFAPFNTIFSVNLEGALLEQAARACNGERGLIGVRIEASIVAGAAIASTVLSATLTDALAPLIHSGDHASLESLIASHAVRRQRFGLPDISDPIRKQADELANERFLNQVYQAAPPGTRGDMPPAKLLAIGCVRSAAPQPRVVVGDIGDWLQGSTQAPVMMLAGEDDYSRAGNLSPTSALPARLVSLPVDLAGASIASIEFSAGSAHVTFEPPFRSQHLNTGESTARILTRFTTGEQFEAEVNGDDAGWLLTTADLGLVEVVVTASPPAGSGGLAIDAFYQPLNTGIPDRRAVRLPDASGSWTARWFVASLAPSLDGEIVLTLTALDASGQPLPSRTMRSNSPTISV